MLNLNDVYREFLQTSNNDKIAAGQKFIIYAKKQDAKITLNDCRRIMGYFSEDEKENLNLAQQFRMNVLNPTRNYITKKMFNLTDSQIDSLWGRSDAEKTPEEKSMQQQVLEKLPNRTRVVKPKTMDYLDELLT